MREAAIHVFNHHAMATFFQVRIANQEKHYAAQAAQAAFEVTDRIESLLSRYQQSSEISQAAQLEPGARMRLSPPVFECLEIAHSMETATRGAFSIAAAALRTQPSLPRWHLDPEDLTLHCESGRLEFDLGAIGKGFALDQMSAELSEWDCPSFLLVAGGSSTLAGDAPPGVPGWSAGLGESTEFRLNLAQSSLSGSGFAVKGHHIIDPRTGKAAEIRNRAWAIAGSAAVSDALSTACMVLDPVEIVDLAAGNSDWLIAFKERENWLFHGSRPIPLQS